MKTTLAEQVAKIMKTYNNPKDYRALTAAIEGLITTHVEQRGTRAVAELAVATCLSKPKHNAGKVVCAECLNFIAYPQADNTGDFWKEVEGSENAV